MSTRTRNAASGGDEAVESAALTFDKPTTLVGGGDLRQDMVTRAIRIAPNIVAADGGANRLRAWGLPAAAVVGDMDSIAEPEYWRRSGAVFLREDEQNSTDLAKCLRLVRAPLYLAVGFVGDRLDHTMAAFGIAAACRVGSVILVAERDIAFPAPLEWEGRLPKGARLSIVAMRPVRVLRSSGLRWPPTGLEFDLGATRGVSNEVEGGVVRVAFDRPGALLILRNQHLEEAACSLARSTGALGI